METSCWPPPIFNDASTCLDKARSGHLMSFLKLIRAHIHDILFSSWRFALHDQVGIGNALAGLGRVMIDAMIENRILLINSLILEKFCTVVPCSLNSLPNGFTSHLSEKGVNVTHASHCLINFSERYPALIPILEACKCGQSPPPSDPGDFDWPYRCFYAKILRRLIDRTSSNGGMIQSEKLWLKK